MHTHAVYKYSFPVNDEISLELPIGAEVLTVQDQRDTPQLWALVDTQEDRKEIRTFVYIGTGHKHPKEFWLGLKYITTFQQLDGSLVWHVFERPIEWV